MLDSPQVYPGGWFARSGWWIYYNQTMPISFVEGYDSNGGYHINDVGSRLGWHTSKNYRVETRAGINNGYWGVYVNGVMVDQFWLHSSDFVPCRGEGRASGLQNDLRARFTYAQCLDRGSWSNFKTTGGTGHLTSPAEGGNTYFEWQGGADWSYFCVYNVNYPH